MSEASSRGEAPSVSGGGGGGGLAKITRTLVVESTAHDGGVRSTLYCRVSLAPNSTLFPQAHPLLTLTPLSHLLHHSTYSLPLRFSLGSSSTDAIEAARKLSVPLLENSSHSIDGDQLDPHAATVGRAEGRRGGGVFPTSTTGEPAPEITLKQDDKQIALWLDPSPPSPRTRSPTSDSRPITSATPTGNNNGAGAIRRRRRADSATTSVGEERLEWIVVLRIETTHGGLQAPRFANTIALPLPPCLRNILSFTLPSVPSSHPWDLSVRPHLRARPSTSPPSPDGSPDRTIHGSFPSTSLLHLVWTPRAASDAPLELSRAKMEIHWSIGEKGYGKAEVRVKGEVERYTGLREKATVDLAVVVGVGAEDAGRMWDVRKVEGDVAGWEVIAPPSSSSHQPPPATGGRQRDSLETPIRRPRPSSTATPTVQQRPPSFTSLFDTPEPIAPVLAPELLDRMHAQPSLLGTQAPFDAANESMDMTFELESNPDDNNASPSSPTFEDDDRVLPSTPTPASFKSPPPPSSSPSDPTLLRIQLPLSTLLTPLSLPSPTFSLHATFLFPSITLLALHSAFSPSAATSTPFRLSLPTFSLPAARSEDTVVTVSAGLGGSVELLGPTPEYRDEEDSPLPAVSGKARWRTQRNDDDDDDDRKEDKDEDDWTTKKRRTRSANASECVEVEVSLPPTRPTSIVLVDGASPFPSPNLSRTSPATWSKNTNTSNPLHSAPSRSSLLPPSPSPSSLSHRFSTLSLTSHSKTLLSPIHTRLTPVPPLAPHLPWRIFAHATFSHPFSGSFDLPLRDGKGGEGQTVEVTAAWDGEGRSVEVEGRYWEDERGECRRVKVDECEGGVKEVQYVVVECKGEDGKVRIGDVLVRVRQKVAEIKVEVLDAAGYRLQTDGQTFDAVSPSSGSSTTFTKFLVAPSTTSRLGVFLSPSSPSLPPLPPISAIPPPLPTLPQLSTPKPRPTTTKPKPKEMTGFQQLGPPAPKRGPLAFLFIFFLWILAVFLMIRLPAFLATYFPDDDSPATTTPQAGAPLTSSTSQPFFLDHLLSPTLSPTPTPTAVPTASSSIAIPTVTHLPPTPTPAEPEEIRGKEIEPPFDPSGFDWSFGILPLVRGRAFVGRVLRWLGLWD